MILGKIRHLIKGNQKGDVFVMAAASMAAVMFCSAAVVDLGSLYSHKSKLQNAADAAALAGAHAFADKKETVDKHPEADDIAETYVERNLGEDSHASRKFKAKSKNDAIYYRVVLEDDAPTYFYRYFFKDPPRISVESIASINENMTEKDNGASKTNTSEDVFIFSEGFSIDGPTTSRGKDAILDQNIAKIESTFDGNIKWTDGTGGYHPDYIPSNMEHLYDWDGLLKYYYTSKGKNEDLYTKQIEDMGEARFKQGYAKKAEYLQYDIDEFGRSAHDMILGTTPLEYPQEPKYEEIDYGSLDWSDYVNAQKKVDRINQENQTKRQNYENAKTAYNNAYAAMYQGQKSISSKDLDSNKAYTAVNGDGNVEVNINGKIPGDTNEPVYYYLDESITQINMSLSSNNERPLVLCYMGTGALHLAISDGISFRGVIYAPHMSSEGIVINGNNITFEGAIITKSIFIHGKNSTFKANNFGIPGLGSNASNSSGNGSHKTSGNESTPTKNIHLSDPPDDINWND